MSKKFSLLVAEAVQFERNLRALTASDQKISAKGMMEASLKEAGGATVEQVDELLARFNADPVGFQRCHNFVNAGARLMTGGGPAHLSGPMPLARQGFLGLEAARAELPAGTEPRLLWCAAVKVAIDRHPEAFGAVDDMPAHLAMCAEMRRSRDDMFARIEAAWDASDVEISEPPTTSQRDAGLRLVTFRLAPTVAVGPKCGERLVAALLARPIVAEKAA